MNVTVSNQNYFANFPIPDALPNQSGIDLYRRFAQIKKIEDNVCYDTISARYPGMDSVSKFIIGVFCENRQGSLDVGKVHLSNQGIRGMGEAFRKNTNLRSFQISVDCLEPDRDCLTTFSHVFSSALKENRELNFLNLDLGTASVGQSFLAVQEFFSNLPCFNLRSLAINGFLSLSAATMFPDLLSQKFPLTNFSWNTGLSSTDPSAEDQISLFSNGISKNSCVKVLDLSPNGCSGEAITTLFRGVGSSRIEEFRLPQFVNEDGEYGPYVFTDEQKAEIVKAVKSNSCLLRCVPFSEYLSLPKDLASDINNITLTRTACLTDSMCNTPASCPVSNPPSSTPRHLLAEGILAGFGTAFGAVAIVSLVTCAKNYRVQCRDAQV